MVRGKKTETPEILSGWKSISKHLGMGVRTVQRYERLMGLPIRRPAGRLRGSVLATKSELDAWVAASPIRQTFQLSNLPVVSPSHTLDSVKKRVAEMSALRDHMVALCDEVKGSMLSLNMSVATLRRDLRRDPLELPSWPIPDRQVSGLLEELPLDSRATKRPKAS